MLSKWVDYLETVPESRPQLNEWRQASADQAAAVARNYQSRFEAQAAKWNERMAEYRAKARKMLAERNMPPPDKPVFDPAADPFFFDVNFGSGPFAISGDKQEKVFRPEAVTKLAALRAELDQVKKAALPEPAMACSVAEGDPVKQKVLIRGDYNNLGEDAPQAFPKILMASARQPEVRSGSGRGQLADWLANPAKPTPGACDDESRLAVALRRRHCPYPGQKLRQNGRKADASGDVGLSRQPVC